MEINKINPNEVSDFRDLVKIFNIVFENEEAIPGDQHLDKLLKNPDFTVFVVKSEKQVLGGLTIFILHSYYGTKPIAYIYDVGISPEWQGKGLGKELIAEVCNFCKDNGFEDAYVEAETDDIDAVNFYRKTKFSNEMHAIHFTYTFDSEKE